MLFRSDVLGDHQTGRMDVEHGHLMKVLQLANIADIGTRWVHSDQSVGKIENKMGIRPAQVSEMIFKDVIVPVENRLGKEGESFKIAMNTLDDGRIGVAAQGLGIAEGAYEIARKYMMEREQFRKAIFKNQYLAFKMAELKVKIEQARL